MKFILVLPIYFFLLFPSKVNSSGTDQVTSVCESFAAGKIDALKTLEALDLNINDYSIGLTNTVRIFCA
tara:strand:- start:743 stop:949 length:207 start_codon:yes stop_codon:yes gene_type:complete